MQARYAARLALAGLEAILGRRLFTDRTCRETDRSSIQDCCWPPRRVAALAAAARPNPPARPRRAAGGRAAGRRPMPVEVAVARTDTVVDAILATGQIEAMQSIELRPDVEGRIAEILVREGAVVTPGHAALQGGRRRAQGAGGPGRGRPRSGAAGARPDARPAGPEGVVAVRARAGRGHRAEHRGAAGPAQGPAAAHHGARAVRRRGRPALGEPGRLRHHRHPAAGAADGVAAAGRRSRCPSATPSSSSSASRSPSGWRRCPASEFTGRVDFVDPVVQLPGRTITVKALVPNSKRELQSGMFIEARLATAVRPERGGDSGGRGAPAAGRQLRLGRRRREGDPPPGGARRAHARVRRGAHRRRGRGAGRGRRPGAPRRGGAGRGDRGGPDPASGRRERRRHARRSGGYRRAEPARARTRPRGRAGGGPGSG